MGLGDDNAKNAARSRAGGTNGDVYSIDPPSADTVCKRCGNTGLLPVAYKTVDGEPALGVACCNCEWGEFYYAVFTQQGMNPTYYDNWPEKLTNKTLDTYHNIVEFARQLYWAMRKEAGLGYRDLGGAWVAPPNLVDDLPAIIAAEVGKPEPEWFEPEPKKEFNEDELEIP